MYLLKPLRHQGMSGEQLSVVTYSIIASRILYALPAWGGFLSAKLTSKINALFRRLNRFGYITCNITVSPEVSIKSDSVRFDRHLWSWSLPQTLFISLSILCIICYRQRESIVTCEIVVISYKFPEYSTNLHKVFYYSVVFFTFVSCLLTVTLHLVDVSLTCLLNITYLLLSSGERILIG